MMVIDNNYKLGSFVYLKTDPDQFKRQITEVRACLDGGILYTLSLGTEITFHYEKEFSETKNHLIDV